MVGTSSGPKLRTLRERRLGAALRHLRAESAKTRAEVASAMGFSVSKLHRLEYGKTPLGWRDVRDLCELYEASPRVAHALIALAKASTERGWWTAFKDVFKGSYVAFENEAATILTYETELVPGLLQTASYLRALICTLFPEASEEERERRVTARMARQEVLDGKAPPELSVIVSEAVIARCVAIGPSVACEQLRALIAASERPTVTIRILPFAAGLHAGMDGSFVILAFPEEDDPGVAYIEGLMGDVYSEHGDDIGRYSAAWERMGPVSLGAAQSREFLASTLKGLNQ